MATEDIDRTRLGPVQHNLSGAMHIILSHLDLDGRVKIHVVGSMDPAHILFNGIKITSGLDQEENKAYGSLTTTQ